MNIEHKKVVIIDAFNRQEEQLDDSKLVDAMFGFLPRTDPSSDRTAFKGLERSRKAALEIPSEAVGSVPASRWVPENVIIP
ncbi:hypothetical protein TNCT_85441 [Trichonephila clavata]|uniref:Uncharacterized protein n=1 Tax=Trichonephila clavata TaxID=2740835 RepID=A0A8X6ISS5_TRICU|nr:hypothetical protein TNCT_85441 [Trichonephila clavata]